MEPLRWLKFLDSVNQPNHFCIVSDSHHLLATVEQTFLDSAHHQVVGGIAGPPIEHQIIQLVGLSNMTPHWFAPWGSNHLWGQSQLRLAISSEKCGYGRNAIWRCTRWWDFSFWRCMCLVRNANDIFLICCKAPWL